MTSRRGAGEDMVRPFADFYVSRAPVCPEMEKLRGIGLHSRYLDSNIQRRVRSCGGSVRHSVPKRELDFEATC